MCDHCGCSSQKAQLTDFSADSHHHHHHHLHQDQHALVLQQSLLQGNQDLADKNRQWLSQHQLGCINLMGTPGAGKTLLLEATLARFAGQLPDISVLEGDQQTLNDAERIRSKGGKVVQINTGTGCHLDADMIRAGLTTLDPSANSLVMIENVGNLVCPALFDLGEGQRVAMMAVTDGDDKPDKYPHMFSNCDLVLVNKCDLLPYVEFDMDKVRQSVKRLNPKARVLALSAKTGEHLELWRDWLLATTPQQAGEPVHG